MVKIDGVTWVKYANTAIDNKYIAVETLKQSKAGYIRIWELSNFLKPYFGSLSLKALVEIDCDEQGVRQVQTTYYAQKNGTGSTVPFAPGEKGFYLPPRIGCGGDSLGHNGLEVASPEKRTFGHLQPPSKRKAKLFRRGPSFESAYFLGQLRNIG